MRTITQKTKLEQDTALAGTRKAPLVRAETLAAYFDVHKRTILLWADRGDIPSVKVGGARRFDFQQVMTAIEGGGR